MGNSQGSSYQQRCDMCFTPNVHVVVCNDGCRVCFNCVEHATIKRMIPKGKADELNEKIKGYIVKRD